MYKNDPFKNKIRLVCFEIGEEIYYDEVFRAYLPDFEYNLFDVNVEDVRGYAFHSALKSLFAIWHISPKREFLDELKDALMLLFKDLDEKQLDRFLKILVHYLSQARPSEELHDIMEVIRTLPAGERLWKL